MNCIAYESVGIEKFTIRTEGAAESLGLNATPGGQASLGGRVARRVAEVVDFELAQGTLPA